MAQNTPNPVHWRDRAIEVSEAISDAFEVLKAYGARIAEWILFFCLIANILEIFPLPEPFASVFGNIVLGVQSVTLDIAGFGLASMGDHARRRGDLSAAKKAGVMSWTLISVMILTVGLVTLSIIVPATKADVDIIEKVLILVRVIVTVVYGHIVHSLRSSGVEFDNRMAKLEQNLSSVQSQLNAKEIELSSVQKQLSTVQKTVSTLREALDTAKQEVSTGQRKLEAEQQKVSSLEQELETGHGDTAGMHRELNAAKIELEGLRGRLNAKVREAEEMQRDLSSVVTLRRDLNAAQLAVADLRGHLDAKTREVEGVQSQLAGEQKQVSNLQSQLSSEQKRVSNLQSQLDTIHQQRVSSVQSQVSSNQGGQVFSEPKQKGNAGQEKVVDLDSRRKSGQEDDAAEEKIRALHKVTPVQSLTARAISREVTCSPTTAAKWKGIIEEEEKKAVNS